jgi:hypothetical protein
VGKGTPVTLDPKTQILSASFNYLEVTLQRPWMDFSIFNTHGWTLEGEPAGLCSSGTTNDNDGMMPLVPISFVLGIDAQITARWGPNDDALIKKAAATRAPLTLGPIPLNVESVPAEKSGTRTLRSAKPFIVAWVSAVVPLAPPADGWNAQ